MENFVHLHLHTEYSLLDGACRIDRLFERAKELGQKSIAITDHGSMYGVLEFYKKAKENNIKPIIGCEVYLAPRTRFDKDHSLDKNYYHLVLLCKNMQGYKNLIQLVSRSYTEGFYQKPRIDMELLKSHHEGLIALSACIAGKVPQLILARDMENAKKHILEMNEIFGAGNYYLELQDHGIKEQLIINSSLIALSKETGIPLVCTNDVHYLNKSDAKSQDILLCIQTGKTVNDADRMKFETDEFYLKSKEEMEFLFKNVPEALENTEKIASLCDLEFDFDTPHLPSFQNPDNISSKDYLEKKCFEGLEKRIAEIQNKEEYIKRLEYELSVVEKMGFCDYFLIVADFVNFAKNSGIYVGPGRGSGAGSLAAWCLNITEIDPIANHLIFERFLNPERVSMPDFDVDFCFERRHEVIEYVTEKYGSDHVAQIVTFSTMAPRAVIRDVGRVLGMSYSECDKIVKRIPHFLDMTIDKAISDDPELQKMAADPEYKELMEISRSLEGMPRNPSIHAAGVVVTDKPITEYVPLAVNTGMKVTQFTMNEIADLGLLKIDFLGLRYLTIIRDAVNFIRKNEPDFDIRNIPLDDKDTYDMISAGKTAGMFQIESSGMKNLSMLIAPKTIDDITASIALYRPGPKDSIPKYLENRNKKEIEYDIPELKDILDETCGCIIYQEQVMEIFRKLAGYSFGRADIVRRAMSKKKKDVMAREKEYFLYGKKDDSGNIECEGAIKRGIPKDKAEKIFEQMAEFAKYAFNKSHAAAYALISYRTAYLKCKYPREYMASILSAQQSGDKYAFYISECHKMGIQILPPDINKSDFSFTVDGNDIRFGMIGIKGVGEGLIAAIINERSKMPFNGLIDFAKRMREASVNKKALESLICAGAFDFCGKTKATLLASSDMILERVQAAERYAMPGQITLFDDKSDNAPDDDFSFTDMPEFSKDVLLSLEKNACGIYLSGHPLENFPALAEKIGAISLSELNTENTSLSEKEPVRIFAMVKSIVLKQAKTGEKMAFLTVEDLSGECEVILFPKTYKEFSEFCGNDSIIVIDGEINFKDEDIKIIAKKISLPDDKSLEKSENPLKTANQTQKEKYNFNSVNKLYLRFSSKGSRIEKRALALIEIFPGKTPVFIYYEDEKKLYKMDGAGFSLTPFLYDELSQLLGEENVVPK